MNAKSIFFFGLVGVLASGCPSVHLEDKPRIGDIPRTLREHLEDPRVPFKLPQNYKQKTDWRKLVMISDFSKPVRVAPDSKQFIGQTMRNASIYLQGRMGYIKRFEIWARRNDGAFSLAKELEDVGEGRVVKKALEEIEWDIFQSGTIIMSKGHYVLSTGQVHVKY